MLGCKTADEDGKISRAREIISESSLGVQEPPKLSQSPPNGGFVAWLQAAASFLIFTNTWGVINAFGTFQSIYQTTVLRTRSASDISWIGSVQTFLTLFCLLFVGPLFDRGYAIHTMYGGCVAAALGLAMTSLATEYYQFMLAQGVLVGVGFSALFLPAIAIIPTYFTTKKAVALGIGTAGSSIGGIIYTELIAILNVKIGLAWTLRVVALMVLVMGVLSTAVTRVRNSPTRNKAIWDHAALRSTSFVLLIAGFFAGYAGLFIPFFYSLRYAIEVCGFDSDSSLPAATLAILNAGSAIGRVVCGFIGDKFGAVKILALLTSMSAILQWGWLGVHSQTGFLVWAAFYGVISGTFLSLQGPAIANIVSKESSLASMGTWMGICYCFCSTGLLVGNPAAGAIIYNFDSWTGLQTLGAATLTVSAMLLWATQWTYSCK